MQTEVMIKKQVSVFANITDLHKALSISIRKRIGRFMQRHVNQFGSNGRVRVLCLEIYCHLVYIDHRLPL